jgi:hypothetical protein
LAPPKKAAAKPVDLDEEFNDQLAIALMLSTEESAKSAKGKELEGGREAEQQAEDSQLAETSRQDMGPDESADNVKQPSSLTDTDGELASDVHPTEEQTEEAVMASNNEVEEVLSPSPNLHNNPTPPNLLAKKLETIEENTNSGSIQEDHGSLKPLVHSQTPGQTTKGKQKSVPFPQSSVNSQPPQIPSRTSSSKPSSSTELSPPNSQTSVLQTSANDLPQIPSKLHFLPLFSTRATGSLSYLGLSATVNTVLFLREAGDREGRRAFERVGVGKIIEKGFFGKGDVETVVLV